MANQLKQILVFTNVAAGAQATLAHALNVAGTGYIPDQLAFDAPAFTLVAATASQITVRNGGGNMTSCNVLLELWNSPDRALGAAGTPPSTGLTPRPFVA